MNLVRIITTTSTTYTLGLTSDMAYSFSVSAYNSIGESPRSNVISFRTLTSLKSTISGTNLVSSAILDNDRNNINVYPNPASDKLFINGLTDIDITFFDINGKEIFNISKANGSIDISALPQGVYIVKFRSADKIIVKRVIKQ